MRSIEGEREGGGMGGEARFGGPGGGEGGWSSW